MTYYILRKCRNGEFKYVESVYEDFYFGNYHWKMTPNKKDALRFNNLNFAEYYCSLTSRQTKIEVY